MKMMRFITSNQARRIGSFELPPVVRAVAGASKRAGERADAILAKAEQDAEAASRTRR